MFKVTIKSNFTICLIQCAIIPPRSEKMSVIAGFIRLVVMTVTLGAKFRNIGYKIIGLNIFDISGNGGAGQRAVRELHSTEQVKTFPVPTFLKIMNLKKPTMQ